MFNINNQEIGSSIHSRIKLVVKKMQENTFVSKCFVRPVRLGEVNMRWNRK